jgi:hypothetical protein
MAKERRIYEVRITLSGSKPLIWRKLAVPSDITLGRLHEVIQIAMGWTDSHLHQFMLQDKSLRKGPEVIAQLTEAGRYDEIFTATRGIRVFVPCRPGFDELDMDGEDEDAATLSGLCPKVKSKLIYEYDFGDGWEHTIEVQKIVEPEPGAQYPVCLAGKKACPPEDCGGVWGYYDLLEAVADQKHENHDDMLEWLGDDFDPEAFDLDEVNTMLAEWRG